MDHRKLVFLLGIVGCSSLAVADQPEWQIHANWCANVDKPNGSSHVAYMSTCRTSDQYDSVMACQRDAKKGNGKGDSILKLIEDAGRPAVNAYMANNKPKECK
jgi:hypothetical protein